MRHTQELFITMADVLFSLVASIMMMLLIGLIAFAYACDRLEHYPML